MSKVRLDQVLVDVDCFWCDPLPTVEVTLRRYHKSKHNAEVVIGDAPLSLEEYGNMALLNYEFEGKKIEMDDHRWPRKCDGYGCDYVFEFNKQYDDQFINVDDKFINISRKFHRPDTNEVFRLNQLPIGAMSWFPWQKITCGRDVSLNTDGDGDGRCLFVVIPLEPSPKNTYHADGLTPRTTCWKFDGLVNGYDRRTRKYMGRTWKRSGTPPRITVEKGISSYGGFTGTLVEGRLRGRIESSAWVQLDVLKSLGL